MEEQWRQVKWVLVARLLLTGRCRQMEAQKGRMESSSGAGRWSRRRWPPLAAVHHVGSLRVCWAHAWRIFDAFTQPPSRCERCRFRRRSPAAPCVRQRSRGACAPQIAWAPLASPVHSVKPVAASVSATGRALAIDSKQSMVTLLPSEHAPAGAPPPRRNTAPLCWRRAGCSVSGRCRKEAAART